MIKNKYFLILLSTIFALASCSFTSNSSDESGKDQLLLQLVSYILEEGHYVEKDLNDDFSSKVFETYIDMIDPYKRYFYKSDIENFKEYEYLIDDQFKNSDLTFFNLTNETLLKRIKESKDIYSDIFKSPFDYESDEILKVSKDEEFVSTKIELKDRWRKTFKYYTLNNLNDLISENDSLQKLIQINKDFKFIISEFEEKSRNSSLELCNEVYQFYSDRSRQEWFSEYINSIVFQFDPHTSYFSPDDKDDFDVDMSGNYAGIGARLQQKMDKISVVELISGGPAWRQNKLEVGDILLKVRQTDEETPVSIVGMRIKDAVKLIKGPIESSVILTIKKVDGQITDLKIPRDIVQLEETYAKSSIVERYNSKYGLINLPKFYFDFDDYSERNAASDIKKEIFRLKDQGMEGLILDLRNNGGGGLKPAVDMAGLFIEEGPIVQVQSFEKKKEILKDKDRSIAWDGPLVILVNEFSASSSEILAAAMQDYKRAIIIGSSQTYGKGTVQNVLDLNRMIKSNTNGDMGALKFTIQKYYRVNGGSVQLEGVKSDIVIPNRYSYIDFGEKEYENPLEWDKITPADYTEWSSNFDYSTAIEKSKLRIESNEYLKLIDDNAKWIKSVRDNEEFSLNYFNYAKKIKEDELTLKSFDKLKEFQTDLEFKSLPYEVVLFKKDSTLELKRNRWHKNLAKDIYVDEALNVLNDLKISYNN
ncbi:carboxy terminal-processing peptidase [Flavobacteriaceae bacterium]|nr:carboxy terminal-processing peptidase [Flavobacteriaceae bacterium]MDC1492257.1 carboxy terminal-processing peptidase [Flavobacteriaceae bacterium]